MKTRRKDWTGTSGAGLRRFGPLTSGYTRGDSGSFSITPTANWPTGAYTGSTRSMWWTEEKYPKTVYSTGSKRIFTDIADAPDTQVVAYEFDSFTCTWEHRFYAGNEAEKHSIGCYFYGTKGTLHLGWRDGWTFYPQKDEHDDHDKPSETAQIIARRTKDAYTRRT